MNRQTLTNGGNGLKLRMIIQRILDQADQHELTTGHLADLFLFSLLMQSMSYWLLPNFVT